MFSLLEQSQRIWFLSEHLHCPLFQIHSILLPCLILLAHHDLEVSLCPHDQRTCVRVQHVLGWTENSLQVKLSVSFIFQIISRERGSECHEIFCISWGLPCIVLTEGPSLFTQKLAESTLGRKTDIQRQVWGQ